MRTDPDSFRFEPDLSGRINGRSFYWRLPNDIRARHELFAAFSDALCFTEGAADAWDELRDGLRDLTWMPDRKLVLIHETLPRLPDLELRIYLAVLRDAVRWWRIDERHRLEVVFPESMRERIAQLTDGGVER